MAQDDAQRRLAQGLDEIARSVSAATIEAEMGAMCRASFFQRLHAGEAVDQGAVDDASLAFAALTDRLMPAALVHRFVRQTCLMRLAPDIRHADLVPGFASTEALAGEGAAARLASPMKKFTQQEVLDCLQWNQVAPGVPVAIAHLVHLVEGYVEGLRQAVARHAPAAAERLLPFARQWAPKNVLKFVNVALFVAGRGRAGNGTFVVDQALVEDAMELLGRAGAFTWDVRADAGVAPRGVTRIHCPAHAFLHRLLASEGALVTVLDFVAAEAAKRPPTATLAASLAFIERSAIAEEAGIRTFGQDWSRMKLEP